MQNFWVAKLLMSPYILCKISNFEHYIISKNILFLRLNLLERGSCTISFQFSENDLFCSLIRKQKECVNKDKIVNNNLFLIKAICWCPNYMYLVSFFKRESQCRSQNKYALIPRKS